MLKEVYVNTKGWEFYWIPCPYCNETFLLKSESLSSNNGKMLFCCTIVYVHTNKFGGVARHEEVTEDDKEKKQVFKIIEESPLVLAARRYKYENDKNNICKE